MGNPCPDSYLGLKFHFQVTKSAIFDHICKNNIFLDAIFKQNVIYVVK